MLAYYHPGHCIWLSMLITCMLFVFSVLLYVKVSGSDGFILKYGEVSWDALAVPLLVVMVLLTAMACAATAFKLHKGAVVLAVESGIIHLLAVAGFTATCVLMELHLDGYPGQVELTYTMVAAPSVAAALLEALLSAVSAAVGRRSIALALLALVMAPKRSGRAGSIRAVSAASSASAPQHQTPRSPRVSEPGSPVIGPGGVGAAGVQLLELGGGEWQLEGEQRQQQQQHVVPDTQQQQWHQDGRAQQQQQRVLAPLAHPNRTAPSPLSQAPPEPQEQWGEDAEPRWSRCLQRALDEPWPYTKGGPTCAAAVHHAAWLPRAGLGVWYTAQALMLSQHVDGGAVRSLPPPLVLWPSFLALLALLLLVLGAAGQVLMAMHSEEVADTETNIKAAAHLLLCLLLLVFIVAPSWVWLGALAAKLGGSGISWVVVFAPMWFATLSATAALTLWALVLYS